MRIHHEKVSMFVNGGNFKVDNVGRDRWICAIDRPRCPNDGSIGIDTTLAQSTDLPVLCTLISLL